MIISTLVVPVVEEEFVDTTHDDNEVEGADKESNQREDLCGTIRVVGF